VFVEKKLCQKRSKNKNPTKNSCFLGFSKGKTSQKVNKQNVNSKKKCCVCGISPQMCCPKNVWKISWDCPFKLFAEYRCQKATKKFGPV
jgi:hypothetical protein